MTDLFAPLEPSNTSAAPPNEDSDEDPGRIAPVTISVVLLLGVALAMCAAAVPYIHHMTHLPALIRQAEDELDYKAYGYQVVSAYIRDIEATVVALAFLALAIWTARGLWRGKSASRIRALVISGFLSISCLIYGRAFGLSTLVDGVFGPCGGAKYHYQNNPGCVALLKASDQYTVRLAELQRQAMPGWSLPLAKWMLGTIVLATLLMAVMLTLPRTTAYFQAKRRSGTY
jgi:hypothetical protein